MSEHRGPAVVGSQQGGEHGDGGGLAGAVGAEHAVDGAGPHLQIDAVDGAIVAEDFDEAFRLDGELGIHPGPFAW